MTILCRIFCVSQYQKNFEEETFCVSECFACRKILCIRWAYHDFVSDIFCLAVPKKIVEETCVSESFGCRRSLCISAGYHDFLSEYFPSHSTKKFRRGTLFCFGKIPLSKNLRDKRRGWYHIFLSKLFYLTVPKNFPGETLSFSKNFWHRCIYR